MDNKITFIDEEGNAKEFYVLEETRLSGINYILVTDAEEDEDGECYVMKDVSAPEDPYAVYNFVEEDDELESVFRIFSELMEDSDTELTY